MNLKDYLHEKSIRPSVFAVSANLTPSIITRLIRGERLRVSPDTALKISSATGGSVTVEELLYPNSAPQNIQKAKRAS